MLIIHEKWWIRLLIELNLTNNSKSSDSPAEENRQAAGTTSAGGGNQSGSNSASAGIEPLKATDDPEKPDAGEAGTWSTPELVDAILEENFALRQQVQNHKDNIAKLQKVIHFIQLTSCFHFNLIF